MVLLAYKGDQPVGIGHCTVGEYYIGTGAKIAMVNLLWVKKEVGSALGGGRVAIALIRGLRRWVSKQEVKETVLNVTSGPDGTTVHKWVSRMGYELVGVIMLSRLETQAISRSLIFFRPVVTCFLFLLTVDFPAHAEDGQPDFTYPISRFKYQNLEQPSLAYWASPISLSIVGSASSEMKFTIASRLANLARHAEVDISINSEITLGEEIIKYVHPSVNYLFVFDEMPQNWNSQEYLGKETVDFSQSSQILSNLISDGVSKVGDGCFSGWSAGDDNEIYAYIVFVDNNASEYSKSSCVLRSIPDSFGILRLFTTLDFSQSTPPGSDGIFIDESELVLLARISAFCRNEIKNNTFSCAAAILNNLYDYHGRIRP